MKTERAARSIVFVDEDKESNLGSDELTEFEEHLSLSERVIHASGEDVNDIQNEDNLTEGIKLYKCSDENGSDAVFVKEGPLKQADLNSTVKKLFTSEHIR